MESKNKQTNKKNESDASLTASKQQAGTPENAPKSESGATNVTNSEEGAGQTAPNSENTATSTENGTQEVSTDDQAGNKTDRIRFSGAARKRYRHLRTLGHSVEIARILAIENPAAEKPETTENNTETTEAVGKPMRDIILKRFNLLRLKGYTIPEARKLALEPKLTLKTIQTISPLGTPAKPGAQSGDGETKSSIIRVVVKATKPGVLLTKHEQRLVQEGILKQIFEFKGTGVKPSFVGQAYKAGWMVLSCANQSTLTWLKKIIGRIKPWPTASLKVVEENTNNVAVDQNVFGAIFPNSCDDTSRAILGFIEAQNEGILTKQWKILNRIIEGGSVVLTLRLDKPSIEKLKGMGSRVCYKFGKVHFKPREAQPQIVKSNIPPLRNGNSARSGPPNQSGSRNQTGIRNPPNRTGPTNRTGPPNRSGPSNRSGARSGSGPIRNNRQVGRSHDGPSNRGSLNRSSGRPDLFSRRSGNNRGSAGGDRGRNLQNGNSFNNSRNFSSGPSIPNQLSEFANNIDKLRSLMQQQQPSSNNNMEMFSRRGDNNPPARMNDNYGSSNNGNSNFRDSGFQNSSGYRDPPNYGGNSSNFGTGFGNSTGTSSNNFRAPSNFGNSSNNYGNSSSNFGSSNFDNIPSLGGSSRQSVWDNFESTGKSQNNNSGGGGGWFRR